MILIFLYKEIIRSSLHSKIMISVTEWYIHIYTHNKDKKVSILVSILIYVNPYYKKFVLDSYYKKFEKLIRVLIVSLRVLQFLFGQL